MTDETTENNSNAEETMECDDNDDNICKYFHHEPYYTPNNFDLAFDYNSIPLNIQPEKVYDLRNRLQKLMPLTKIIHLQMDNDTIEENGIINLNTQVRIRYNKKSLTAPETGTPEEYIETITKEVNLLWILELKEVIHLKYH